MLQRMYSCTFEAVAITAVQDIFELLAGTNDTVRLYRLRLFQTTDLGDAQEEVLRIRIRSGQTVSGSGGSSGTEVPIDVGDGAATSAVLLNNTTQAGTGTIVTNEVLGWNIRVPLDHIWTPEDRPCVRGARRVTVELVAAPTDSITVSGVLVWGEG